MKTKILLVTDDFLPIPSANGVCIYNLARSLKDRGNSVKVLANRKNSECRNEQIDGISIIRINYLNFIRSIKNKTIQQIVVRANLLLHFSVYPLTSFIALFRYNKAIYTIIKEQQIELVITTNNPFIGCLSGVYAKRKFGTYIKFVVYDVDSFTNTLPGRFLSLAKKRKKIWKWENYILNHADLVLIMRNHEKYYDHEKYKQIKEKIRIANLPMIYPYLSKRQKAIKGVHGIYCVFIGTISQKYRNPKIVCEIFARISDTNLHFYGKIDNSIRIINRFSEITHRKIQHMGMIPFLEGQAILQCADVLINIGNCESDMVPSKTFEYMSYCKPIIHFFYFKDDPVIDALSRYPAALLLDANEAIQSLVKKTEEFLRSLPEQRVEPKVIQELFSENTPEFSIDLIEEFFTL